jgi:hypothetical protein
MKVLHGSVVLNKFSKIDPLPIASQLCENTTHGVPRKRKVLNATEPRRVLCDLPAAKTLEDVEALLPWNLRIPDLSGETAA